MADEESSAASFEKLAEEASSLQAEEEEAQDEEDAEAELEAYLMAKSELEEATTFKNDEDALKRKLEDIRLGGGKVVPWVETLVLTAKEAIQTLVDNPHDDLKRETGFYTHVEEEGQAKLEQLNIPYRRPDDYFAEMVKSDKHMERIRAELLKEKKHIEEREQRRKQRELKKYGKKVQQAKQLEKQKQKKEILEAIKKWRKERQKGGAVDDEFPIELEDEQSDKQKSKSKGKDAGAKLAGQKRKQPEKKKSTKNPFERKKSKKRQYKDKKYGYGGPKKHKKDNTAESAADMSEWSKRRNKALPRPLADKMGFKKSKSKPNRPGKRARQHAQGRAGAGKKRKL